MVLGVFLHCVDTILRYIYCKRILRDLRKHHTFDGPVVTIECRVTSYCLVTLECLEIQNKKLFLNCLHTYFFLHLDTFDMYYLRKVHKVFPYEKIVKLQPFNDHETGAITPLRILYRMIRK